MPKTLIIVRTYKADEASLQTYDLYARIPGQAVIFCVDERAAQADMGGRHKVAFDNARLEQLGLYPHPNAGWLCGDYFYHVTRAAHPGYDFYWLVEPDVRINVPDPAHFFALFNAKQADLLAPRLAFNDQTWPWTAIIAATGLPPWRCFYPITRLSGRAIDHVHAIRREQGGNPAIATEKAWPNDEAITASALQAAGFACADLDHGQGPCHTGASLNGVALIDPDILATLPPDGLIYHPVRSFAAWFTAAQAQIARIEREFDEQKRPGRLIAQAVALTRIAQTCQRNPDYADASLILSLQAQALWARRPQPTGEPTFKQKFEAESARLCTARLNDHFGVNKHRPPTGTAHLARKSASASTQTASIADFDLGPAFILGRLPRRACLPYAWDIEAETLLLTVHLNAAEIFDATSPIQKQRDAAKVVAFATLAQLASAYRPANASPLIVAFAGTAAEATRLTAHLHPETAAVTNPAVLETLAQAVPAIGTTLPAALFEKLVRYTIEPFRHVTLSTGRIAPRCLVLHSIPNRLVATIGRQFPDARLLILPGADTPGLRAAIQRTPHEVVVCEVEDVLSASEERKQVVLF